MGFCGIAHNFFAWNCLTSNWLELPWMEFLGNALPKISCLELPEIFLYRISLPGIALNCLACGILELSCLGSFCLDMPCLELPCLEMPKVALPGFSCLTFLE